MSDFIKTLSKRIESYIELQRSLGYSFRKQASTLHAFVQYMEPRHPEGPLTQEMVLNFLRSCDVTANSLAINYGVIRRFAEYLAVYDPQTQPLARRVLPRSRAIPPPRILTDIELESLIAALNRLSPAQPQRERTLATLVGLLASTGLRSGEALRLERADVDLTSGVLHIRKSKFRKDRLVPVHTTTLEALREYACRRDQAFPKSKCPAFFLGLSGARLSQNALYDGFRAACALAGLNRRTTKRLRPHDLRHRFAVARLAAWHQEKADVQALLPLLATYLGHTRYSDTAYYITGTAELLGLASERAFGDGGAS